MKGIKRKPSKIIEDFLELIEESHQFFTENEKAYKELDKNFTVWAHKFEFAKDKNERNRLGTAYQKERKQRRECKDIAELYESIHEFAMSENNKATIKRLKGMLIRQQSRENYLFGDRKYKAGDKDGSDT